MRNIWVGIKPKYIQKQLQHLFNLLDLLGRYQSDNMINNDHLNSLSLYLKLQLSFLRHECFNIDIMFMADKFLEEDLVSDTVIDEIIEEGLLDEFYEVQHVEDS